MARDDPTIYMRIPADLKDQLDAAASSNRRSLTAEVVARLQASFVGSNSDSLAPLLARLERSLGTAETELARIEVAGAIVAEVLSNANDELPQGSKFKWIPGSSSQIERTVEKLRAGFTSGFNRLGTLSGELAELKEILDSIELPDSEISSLRKPKRTASPHKPGTEIDPAGEPEFLKWVAESLFNTPEQDAAAGFKPEKLSGLANANPAALTDELGFKPKEHLRGLADAEPAKAIAGLGLSNTSTATGVGSKPLPQRTDLADAKSAKPTYAAGAEKIVKSVASKRAKPINKP